MWDGVDRRRFPRAEYPCLITLRKSAHYPHSILTHTVNISVNGVRVVTGKRIDVLTDVDLEIDLMDTFPTISTKGRVRWVKPISSEREGKPPQFEVGIQFIALADVHRRRIQKIVEHLISRRPPPE